MNLQDYKKCVLRTINADFTDSEMIQNFSFCLIEEVGEVIGILKKHFWHNHNLDKDKLIKEFGDCFWYLVALSEKYGLKPQFNPILVKTNIDTKILLSNLIRHAYNISSGHYPELENNMQSFITVIIQLMDRFDIDLSTVLIKNNEKLEKRYKKEFSFEESKNRVDVDKKEYTEKQLVDFGNYILSDERKQKIKDNHEISKDKENIDSDIIGCMPLQEKINRVQDSDLRNCFEI